MSRAHNARRKAKRQQARTAREDVTDARRLSPRRLVALVPVLAIVAILGVVAVMGFGSRGGANQEQIGQEVTELLSGIPQKGATLGNPDAPITLRIFADLECPTVKRFATKYLPSFITKWVRTGAVKLEYRSLRTDTSDERLFFKQEVAALAAGRQDKMWDFFLIAAHDDQGQESTNYATDEFLADVASRVPDLRRAQWRRAREDTLLSKQVAHGIYAAHSRNFRYTPSLLIGSEEGEGDRDHGFNGEAASLRKEVEASLGREVQSLREEDTGDIPTLGVFGAG